MKIRTLQLRELTVFERAEWQLASGINLFIGENGTGKTHVMKLLYAVLRAAHQSPGPDASAFADALRRKLAAVFRPDEGELRHLIRRGKRTDEPTFIAVEADCGATAFTIGGGADMAGEPLAVAQHHWDTVPPARFIPSQEVLSIFEGFIAAYTQRELAFDETYYDLCVALDSRPLRDSWMLAALQSRIEQVLGGTVHRDHGRFYVDLGAGKIEAHLVAEGLRKLASIVQLVANGSIAAGTALFWDEPESSLNPRITTQVADFLVTLAGMGVQVFVSTHDYLLSRKLGRAPGVDRRVFSLFQDPNRGVVEVEAGDSIDELDHNPILAEFERQYEEEIADIYQDDAGDA